jgi:CubicO group peptidase (beta-lactamase class C family)
MLKRRLLVGWWLCAVPAWAQAQAPVVEARLRGFDAYVAKGVLDWKVPGLAVAVVKDGRVAFAKGYGVRELGRPEPVTTRTLFAVGSTTKAMTAALLAMLADEGKLGLDDPVIRHLPAFVLSDPVLTREVTVRDLLTHRAGMPNTDFLWYRTGASPAEVLKRFALVKRETSLRSRFTYQNVMYHAAGEVAAAAGRASWADLMRQRLFDPLGMAGTAPTLGKIPPGTEVAVPHDEVAGVTKAIRNAAVDNVAAAGSVWSSVEDMAKWVSFLLAGGEHSGKRLLREASLRELFTPQAIVGPGGFYPTARLTRPHWTTYGLGWFQQDYDGRAVDFHTGSIDGMVAICGLVRDEKLGVVVLANRDHAELRHALMLRVFDAFGRGPGRDWNAELLKLYGDLKAEGQAKRDEAQKSRIAGTQPTLALADYAGVYEDPLYGTATVTEEAGSLLMAREGELRARLEHWSHDTWKATWDMDWVSPVFVRFEVDARGRASRLFLGDLDDPSDQWTDLARREDRK